MSLKPSSFLRVPEAALGADGCPYFGLGAGPLVGLRVDPVNLDFLKSWSSVLRTWTSASSRCLCQIIGWQLTLQDAYGQTELGLAFFPALSG